MQRQTSDDATELVDPSTKEFLWHSLREDLLRYLPEIKNSNLLMCCACGRLLEYEDFGLEHIIPQQAVAGDPKEVKLDPRAPVAVRSGITLLCRKPLRVRDKIIYSNGCNSWKGRFFDKAIKDSLNGHALDSKYRRVSDQHIIAMLCLGYLAMVREFGYQVALTPSGLLMREQFFSPKRFHKNLPMNCQLVLASPPPSFDEEQMDLWLKPFEFTVEEPACLVRCRTYIMRIPTSRDPRIPIAQHLSITPSKYKLRPDFTTVFH